jgi:hypothetical protein
MKRIPMLIILVCLVVTACVLPAVAHAALRPTPDPQFSVTNGIVTAIALGADGSTYVGGQFTQVDGFARNNVARILADGTVDPGFAPNADGTVSAIAVSGSTVYVGGSFSTVGGQYRRGIAALDATAGTATNWDPGANAAVLAVAVSGSTVYAGGAFTAIGGQTRHHIAALSVTTGAARSWDPDANGTVDALAVSTLGVIAGGDFDTIGGRSRSNIASLDPASGAARSWDAHANGPVDALAVSGSHVYAGGAFTVIGGQARSNVAAIDWTGAATSWDPGATGPVEALAVPGLSDTVHVLTIEFTGTKNAASSGKYIGIDAFDIYDASGAVQRHEQSDPLITYTGDWYTLPKDFHSGGSYVYAESAGAKATIRFTGAAIDYITNLDDCYGIAKVTLDGGTPTHVDLYSPVHNVAQSRVFAASASTIYAGGTFASIGGQARNNIASVLTTGSATGWNPNVNATVNSLAVSGSTIYAGGAFTSVGGVSRGYLARFSDPDSTPPVTTVSGVDRHWHVAPVQVTLTAVDPGATASGVASTEYRRQGATTWTPYTGPFVVRTQGVSDFEYRSTDVDGNVETLKTFKVRRNVSPNLSVSLDTTAIWLGGWIKITGAVRPVEPGASATVVLQKRSAAGTWKTFIASTKTLLPNTYFVWHFKPGARGSYRVQIRLAAETGFNAANTDWKPFRVY